jgi:hypothetical protein
MLTSSSALGIDVSNGLINLALVRKAKGAFQLVKAASGPVPEGALKDGNVEDPLALTRAIRKLQLKHRIHSGQSAISLVAHPVLVQVLDLPENMPTNIRSFVRERVRQCAVLPIKDVALDFCGLKTAAGGRKALVVAAANRRIGDTITNMNRVDMNLKIEAVEPGTVALLRALFTKKVALRPEENQLFMIVGDGVTSFYLFRDKVLDFVRTKHPEPQVCNGCDLNSEQCIRCLQREINAIIQYYELEVPDNSGSWEINVLSEVGELNASQLEMLQIGFETAKINIINPEEAYLDTPIEGVKPGQKPSAAAIGLAMKLLGCRDGNLDVNLLPDEANEIKIARKHAWIIANAAAVAVFAMVLSVPYFQMKANRLSGQIKKKEADLDLRTRAVLTEQRAVDIQTKRINTSMESMGTVFDTVPFLKWGQLLGDLKNVTPRNVRITKLSSDDNKTMSIDAHGLSYGAVRLFVEKLTACKQVKSAVLVGSHKDSRGSGLVRYSIKCNLVP